MMTSFVVELKNDTVLYFSCVYNIKI